MITTLTAPAPVVEQPALQALTPDCNQALCVSLLEDDSAVEKLASLQAQLKAEKDASQRLAIADQMAVLLKGAALMYTDVAYEILAHSRRSVEAPF